MFSNAHTVYLPTGCFLSLAVTVAGTSNWAYVTEQLGLRNVVPVRDGDEAVSVLREESVEAYIADSPHIINFAASACDLIVLGPQVSDESGACCMNKKFIIMMLHEHLSYVGEDIQNMPAVIEQYNYNRLHYFCGSGIWGTFCGATI